jgi:acetyl esterase/lipase
MNLIRLIICFIIFNSLSVSAQKTIKIWDITDITRKQKRSELTVFLPETPDISDVSVIICPGGSYYWLDMKNEGFFVAKHLNNYGITAFVLKYRTARHGNRHPAMIQDLERAIHLVKTNCQEYGINPEKVGLMGFSAGGHLAGTSAIYYSESALRPYFAAMIYPVVSMEDSICHKKSRRNLLGRGYSDELKQMMSFEKNVSADMSPVFLMHCTGDRRVDYRNSVVFDNALTEKNVKHNFLLYDEYGHGFGIKPKGKTTGWIDEFYKWLQTL